jgi:hypothetical protein
MKWYYIALMALIGCNEQGKTGPNLSKAQNDIYDIAINYTAESIQAKNELQKKDADEKYQQMLHSYLRKHKMDSMLVNVQRIDFINDTTIKAEFADQNALYIFSHTWDGSAAMEADPVYNYIKTLPVGQDIVLNMHYLGEIAVDKEGKDFVIAVVPKK